MGEEPDRLRAEIEQTRAEMSETVDALGYKADVKTRAKENLRDKRESAKEAIVGVKDTDQLKRRARRAQSVAQENPIGLAVGSVAVGFIAGMLTPATRMEDEKMGTVADDVKGRMKETGQEVLEQGKQVAQEATSSSLTEHPHG